MLTRTARRDIEHALAQLISKSEEARNNLQA